MNNSSVYLYILTAAAMIYLIRMLPLTLIKKEIRNPVTLDDLDKEKNSTPTSFAPS